MGRKATLKPHRATERATDRQIGGNHYQLPISPLKFILANNLNFVDGNIVKYAVRKKKGESLKTRYEKIKHYCDLGIELIKE